MPIRAVSLITEPTNALQCRARRSCDAEILLKVRIISAGGSQFCQRCGCPVILRHVPPDRAGAGPTPLPPPVPNAAQPVPTSPDGSPRLPSRKRSRWARRIGIPTAVVTVLIAVAFIAYFIGTATGSAIIIGSPSVTFEGPAAADFNLVSACGDQKIDPGDSGWSCVISVQDIGSIAHTITNMIIGGPAAGVLIEVQACILHGSGCLPVSVGGGATLDLYLTSYVLNDGGGDYPLSVSFDCSA
jgi:hypothetical protein